MKFCIMLYLVFEIWYLLLAVTFELLIGPQKTMAQKLE